MKKCAKCAASKKKGYMDIGGNFVDMSSSYKTVEPVSGYGTSEANKCPPNCGPGSGAKHAKQVRSRQTQRTKIARKNIGRCRRGPNGQTICD